MAMNRVVYVPTITPSMMAKVKLRMVAPPSMNMHKTTTNVERVVLNVRDKVEFRASLMT